MKVAALALALFLCGLVQAEFPDLPNDFAAKITLTVPFFGKVPGAMYFDYDTWLSYRTDTTSFGQTQIDIYRYDLKNPTHYTIYNGNCQTEPIDGELYPMALPPFAIYKGEQTVNNQNTELWEANFFGIVLQWWVYNTTDSSGKVSWTLSRWIVNMITPIQMDFQQVIPGPQNGSLFDPTQYGCPPPVPPVTYTVSGYIKSATNNAPISGANVKLGSYTASTGSDGRYTINSVAPGKYDLSADASGYFTASKSLNVSSDIGAGSAADLSLSPKLNPNEWRAVLTWGQYPLDLDSHSNTPCSCEVYYSKKLCSCGSQSASLDVDATKGWGPETITYKGITSGQWLYFVYIYSSGSYIGSNAVVNIYNSSGLVHTVPVPQTFDSSYRFPNRWLVVLTVSRYWRVFKLDGASNSITLINDIVPNHP